MLADGLNLMLLTRILLLSEPISGSQPSAVFSSLSASCWSSSSPAVLDTRRYRPVHVQTNQLDDGCSCGDVAYRPRNDNLDRLRARIFIQFIKDSRRSDICLNYQTRHAGNTGLRV